MTITMTAKNQITIPKKITNALGLGKGSMFEVEVSRDKIEQIIDQVDIIEIYNSRTLLSEDNKWALQLASQKNRLQVVGSDAHFLKDISKALNLASPFNDVKSFIISLKSNDISESKLKRTGLLTQIYSKVVKVAKKLYRVPK